jgi:hypothetical protein
MVVVVGGGVGGGGTVCVGGGCVLLCCMYAVMHSCCVLRVRCLGCCVGSVPVCGVMPAGVLTQAGAACRHVSHAPCCQLVSPLYVCAMVRCRGRSVAGDPQLEVLQAEVEQWRVKERRWGAGGAAVCAAVLLSVLLCCCLCCGAAVCTAQVLGAAAGLTIPMTGLSREILGCHCWHVL